MIEEAVLPQIDSVELHHQPRPSMLNFSVHGPDSDSSIAKLTKKLQELDLPSATKFSDQWDLSKINDFIFLHVYQVGVNQHLVAHELYEPIGVDIWLDSRDKIGLSSQHKDFEEWLASLFEVELLQVVDNCQVVNVLTTAAEVLVSAVRSQTCWVV